MPNQQLLTVDLKLTVTMDAVAAQELADELTALYETDKPVTKRVALADALNLLLDEGLQENTRASKLVQAFSLG